MALPSLIDNTDVDTAAAAVPAPFGPLTRVTDLDALAIDPNSEITIEFTTDASTPDMGEVYTVWMSYTELLTEEIRDRLLYQAAGVAWQVQAMIDAIDGINTIAAALTAPYSQEDYEALITAIRTDLPWTRFM